MVHQDGNQEEASVIEIRTDTGAKSAQLKLGGGRSANELVIQGSPGQSAFQPNARKTSLPSDISLVRLVQPDRNPKQEEFRTLLSEIVIRGARDSLNSLLRDLIPNFVSIEILTPQNKPAVFVSRHNGSIPLQAEGDGVKRTIYMAMQLAVQANEIILLEEPETHLHPRAMRTLAKSIIGAVEHGAQIILTTHSQDLIDILLNEAGPRGNHLISVFRLRLDEGTLSSVRRTGEEATMLRTELADDLR